MQFFYHLSLHIYEPSGKSFLDVAAGSPTARDLSQVAPNGVDFNRRYRKVGHLFQGGYKAIICDKEKYLLALLRYIHLNPVRARLVKRPESYAHSGHRNYLKSSTPKIIDTRPVLALLGGPKRYERFVLDGRSEDHNEAYYSVEDQRFLGEEWFGEEICRAAGEKESRK